VPILQALKQFTPPSSLLQETFTEISTTCTTFQSLSMYHPWFIHREPVEKSVPGVGKALCGLASVVRGAVLCGAAC
jgi:hypothetical protein